LKLSHGHGPEQVEETDERNRHHQPGSTCGFVLELDECSELLAQGSGTDIAVLVAELRTKDQPDRERAIRSLAAMLADP